MRKKYTREELNEILFGASPEPDKVSVYKHKQTGEVKTFLVFVPCTCKWTLLGRFDDMQSALNFINGIKGV